MTMRTYRVISEVEHDGETFVAGTSIELDEDAARALLEVEAIAEPDDAHIPAEVQEAIGALDPDDRELWTKGGKPKTEALEAALGREVSADERDAAWDAWQAGRAEA